MYITNTTNEFTMGSSHVVFLNIFFYGDVTQKRHWQKNLPVGFNGLTLRLSETSDGCTHYQAPYFLCRMPIDFSVKEY